MGDRSTGEYRYGARPAPAFDGNMSRRTPLTSWPEVHPPAQYVDTLRAIQLVSELRK